MNKLKIILLIFCLVLSSCGSKDDKDQDYTDDKAPSEETKKKNTEKEKTGNPNQEKNLLESQSKETIVIAPLEAIDHLGKYVTVKGFVADIYQSEKVAYLNFIEKYPNNPFTAVIFASRFDDFPDVNKYMNKNVEVTGRVSLYREKPQIILNNKSQIKIIN